ncbi:MAG: sugar kinase [Bifidobacteriaceae bacterium]|jgi:fructokinase|nr:sugar kinase [Bifidobacteriaceae bacterium]
MSPLPTPKIAVLGEALVGFHAFGDGPFTGPYASGAPCIFASASARLGCPTVVGAGVGQDEFGDLLVAKLAAGGAQVDHVFRAPGLPTADGFVRYHQGGGRRFIHHVFGTAAVEYPLDWVQRVLDGATWLHLCGCTLGFGGPMALAVSAALEQAAASGLGISFDPNVRPESMRGELGQLMGRAVAVATVVLASEGELEALGTSTAALVEQGKTVCHKHGAAGATVHFGGRSVAVPAIKVTEVDPDGAGDIFAAGFVAATLAGRDPVAATELACQVAGESVTVPGPMESAMERLPEWSR